MADHRLDQPVGAERLGGRRHQRVAAQRPKHLPEAQRIPYGASEALGQHLRMLDRQAAGEIVGGQEGA
jgi:hypothetical protein